jgi:acetate CoA/acetoacetate CoA-transferase beta subunit
MPKMDIENIIAHRAARELKDGQIINLGYGMPTLVANHLPPGVDLVIHSENGALGAGPLPNGFCADPDRANAGGEPISLIPGGSYFDSAASFAIIRGGHVDMTFLGAFQVDGEGNIASYEVPGKIVAGMGGAMDLLVGAKIVNVVTEHCSKDGNTKLFKRCTFPLTGAGEADVIITERAVFRRYPDKGFVLEEVARGYTLEDIAACTEMDYVVPEAVKLDAYGPGQED